MSTYNTKIVFYWILNPCLIELCFWFIFQSQAKYHSSSRDKYDNPALNCICLAKQNTLKFSISGARNCVFLKGSNITSPQAGLEQQTMALYTNKNHFATPHACILSSTILYSTMIKELQFLSLLLLKTDVNYTSWTENCKFGFRRMTVCLMWVE